MSECGVLDGLHARAYDACIPLHVSLELTLRCNIRCTHCYNFDRDQPRSGGVMYPGHLLLNRLCRQAGEIEAALGRRSDVYADDVSLPRRQ